MKIEIQCIFLLKTDSFMDYRLVEFALALPDLLRLNTDMENGYYVK